MSRSIKGSKGPGHEYWKRRGLSMVSPGRDMKKLTSRIERRRAGSQMARGESPTLQFDK